MHPFEMFPGFMSYLRNVNFIEEKSVAIRPWMQQRMYYGLPEDALARMAKEAEIEERMNSSGEL